MAVDDPDGPEPRAGSEAYRSWFHRAVERGALKPLDHAEAVPDFTTGQKRFGAIGPAALADSMRKDCLHCHAWDRGHKGGGTRVHAEGCSACHVAYDTEGHSLGHRITVQIRSTQCAHCHWSGHQSQFRDLHEERGIECADCHTSIDVHGDGNIYPTMTMAVEIACEDCHGTPDAFPWELPLGYGTPAVLDGQRGTATADGRTYLMTSRGNARRNLERQGDAVFLTSVYGRERPVPLLKTVRLRNEWRTPAAAVAMETVRSHVDRVECPACHTPSVYRCLGCHLDYNEKGEAPDWVGQARNRPSPFARASDLKTGGSAAFFNRGRAQVETALAKDPAGRVEAALPGCSVEMRVIDVGGKETWKRFSSPVLHAAFHETSNRARSCTGCHLPRPMPPGEPVVHGDAISPEVGRQLLMERAEVHPEEIVSVKPCPVARSKEDQTDDRCIACHQHAALRGATPK